MPVMLRVGQRTLGWSDNTRYIPRTCSTICCGVSTMLYIVHCSTFIFAAAGHIVVVFLDDCFVALVQLSAVFVYSF